MATKTSIHYLEPRVRVKQMANFDQAQLVDPRVPIHRYFRSGTEMLRMANMYNKEGQVENAFILYSKYITLFVERIPKHPEYKSISDEEKAITKKKLLVVFPIAEKLKSQLEAEYAEQYAKYVEEQQKHKDDAQLIKVIESEVSNVKDSDTPYSNNSSAKNIKVGSQCFESSDEYFINVSSPDIGNVIYPDMDASTSHLSVTPPNTPSDSYSRPNSQGIPTVDRSTKPRSLLSPGPEAGYVHGLRMVIIPNDIMNGFLNLAKANTVRNVETCGILAGKMVHNELLVTHVLLPPQTGTSDSCTTDSEEELFAVQDKHDLLTIGWIHTHPSQTAFLSSVDLHTQCSYQLAIPEAVAIVCSPKYNENKIFSLTEFGMDYVTGCSKTGFHLHDVHVDLYTESPHVKYSSSLSTVVIDLRK